MNKRNENSSKKPKLPKIMKTPEQLKSSRISIIKTVDFIKLFLFSVILISHIVLLNFSKKENEIIILIILSIIWFFHLWKQILHVWKGNILEETEKEKRFNIISRFDYYLELIFSFLLGICFVISFKWFDVELKSLIILSLIWFLSYAEQICTLFISEPISIKIANKLREIMRNVLESGYNFLLVISSLLFLFIIVFQFVDDYSFNIYLLLFSFVFWLTSFTFYYLNNNGNLPKKIQKELNISTKNDSNLKTTENQKKTISRGKEG
jgi:hypothetical protein